MNNLTVRKILFYSTALVLFALNVNANDKIASDQMQLDRREGRERFLRTDQIDRTEGRELQTIITPEEIDVDPLSTYNGKFMSLMNSPCRPEYDGYFGATSGDPIRVQYGFKVEVQPLSAIMDILDVIEDKIVDSILQSSFPKMCGSRQAENPNRSLVHSSGHPSGFRFLKFDQVEKCFPQRNEVNFCGIFTGTVLVYGKNQNEQETSRSIMTYINEVLDNSEPHELHSELTLLSSVDKYSEVGGGYTKSTMSRLDILLIIVSTLIVAAIMYYVYIQWNERRYYNPKSSVGDNRDLSRNIRTESEGKDEGGDIFVDEDLQFQPYRDDRKSGAVVL